jgi:hypothetical protein
MIAYARARIGLPAIIAPVRPSVRSMRPQPPIRVYHLAEASNWPAIERHGLHCTSALLDLAGVDRKARARLERQQRREGEVLPSGVRIRDQRPMPPAALARCLVGLSPQQWYAMLNARVFFWLDPERLNRQRAACKARPQVVLTLDAAALVAAYGEHISVTPINTGNAMRQPAPRGAATFVRYAQWLETGWTSEAAALGTRARPARHPPVELTVLGSVPDAMRFVLATRHLEPGQRFTA